MKENNQRIIKKTVSNFYSEKKENGKIVKKNCRVLILKISIKAE